METAEFLILLIQIYGSVGVVVAIPFLLFGIDRIDPSARGSYTFRPLILPGIVLIWPIVVYRWFVLEKSLGNSNEDSTT